MAAQAQTPTEEFLPEEDPFRTNALLLINKMLELAGQARDDVTALVDEIIHSIFFLGKINSPPFSPDEILGGIQDALKDSFPEPFQLFTSHVPRRSPFSCVLDMIVHLDGRENDTHIINDLKTLISDLKLYRIGQSNHLVSSTICVSQNDPDPVKYYGVSISASGKMPRKIMIAASCLGSWDKYVAGAVMTFIPTRKKYFDGTIRLPEGVRCRAFSLLDIKDMLPCALCKQLFGLTPFNEEKTNWQQGNCAEVESLSNFFKAVEDFRERAQPTVSTLYSDPLRDRAKKEVERVLCQYLKLDTSVGFTFYTPQRV